jgi:uncharacterized protein (TIGR03790 family)
VRLLRLFALCSALAAARAGLHPLEVAVVVNDLDPDSLVVGHAYAHLRGIPPGHLLHLQLPVTENLTAAAFTNQVFQPLVQQLADLGLEPQIRQLALAWRRPFRVDAGGGQLTSLPSALLYGIRPAPPAPPCELHPDAFSPLFAHGRAFAPAAHPQRHYPTAMLTAGTRAQTLDWIERTVPADFTRPSGVLHLLRTGDDHRNVQWPQFERADFLARFLDTPVEWRRADAGTPEGEPDIVGLLAGLVTHQPALATNTFRPGALGDHLTSFGGVLFGPTGQMPILDWLNAGCAGSWGTVTEPCNYTNKFPVAELHFWHQRGFTAGEAYTWAVSHPAQGLLAGDPLSAPFATPPQVTFTIPPPALATGVFAYAVQAVSPVAGRRLDRLDLYLDERHHATLQAEGPSVGNEAWVRVGGTNFTTTVQPGDGWAEVAARLASTVDASAHLQAEPGPDYVLIRQAQLGLPGASIAVEAGAAMGSAAQLTLGARSPQSALLETRARARRQLVVLGTPTPGVSRLFLRLKRQDGVEVEHETFAQPGESRVNFLLRFVGAVNAHPDFSLPAGGGLLYTQDFPFADASRVQLVANDLSWRGPRLEIRWEADGGGLTPQLLVSRVDENAGVLGGRAMVFLEAGQTNLTWSGSFDPAGLADGPHRLRVVAREGNAVATPGGVEAEVRVKRHDFTCDLLWPRPGGWILQGSVITALVHTAGSAPVAEIALWAEGKPQPDGLVWDSTPHPPGPALLQARARDTLNRAAWSDRVTALVLADDDRDGMADDWERLHFNGLQALPGDDPDGDGHSNRQEFLAGTLPQALLSHLRLTIVRTPAGGAELTFPTAPDRRFRVEVAPAPPWLPLPDWQSAWPEDEPGTGAPRVWTDAAPEGFRLYRVRATLP